MQTQKANHGSNHKGEAIHEDALRIRRGSQITHKRATYRVQKVNTVQDMDALGHKATADFLRERGQWAYAICKRGTRGTKSHLFRVMFDGTTAWEQAI